MTLEHSELGYVAGVIDMQGIIRTRMAGDTELPVIMMHGSNIALLEYLGELTATRAIRTRRDYVRAGCSEHCREKHQHIVSVSGRWSVTGVKATILLWNIRPFMRLQVEAATSAIVIGLNAPFKPGKLDDMRKLGWDVPEFGAARRT